MKNHQFNLLIAKSVNQTMPNIATYPFIDNIWLYFLLAAIFEALAVYLYQFRKIPGAVPLAGCQACKAVWILCRVAGSMSTDLPTKVILVDMSAAVLVLLLYLWFLFILDVSMQKEKVPAIVKNILMLPVAAIVFIFLLDERLDLGICSIEYFLDQKDLKVIYGPGYWMARFYSYFLYIVCIGFSMRWIFSVKGFRRKQAIVLSVTPVFNIVANIAVAIIGNVALLKDITPSVMGFIMSAIYTTWAFYRWCVYTIIPQARDAVSRTMIDGLIVVDEKDYIVEMNPKAIDIFRDLPAAVDGKFRDAAEAWPDLIPCCDSSELHGLEAVRRYSDGIRYFRVDVAPLKNSGKKMLGRILVFKDITSQKWSQNKMIEQQKAISVLAERDRLGRELHDTQGQFPGYVKTHAQAVRLLMQKDRLFDAQEQLKHLIDAADAAFTNVRESITGLKTVSRDWDFFKKLREYLGQFEAGTGISVCYEGPESAPLEWIQPEAEVHLLRIIQESTTNARKHSMADRILVTLSLGDSFVTVLIEDNGRGFDGTESKNKHPSFGLGIMEERAAEAGGTCMVRSVPGKGTVVTVKIPFMTDAAMDTSY